MGSKKRAGAALRSTTPPAIATISVSAFVRGGLYNITEPTVVMSHSDELGTWYPRGQGVAANYMLSTSHMTSSLGPVTSNSLVGRGNETLTNDTISLAVEAAVMKATQHLEESTTRTITRLMNEQKGNTSGE